jgi:hypothetical protein
MQDFKNYLPQLSIVRQALNPFNNWNNLFQVVENDLLFEQALYVASPNLFFEYNKEKKAAVNTDYKLQKSIAKYHIRSCTRCTPYGLFAALQSVAISEQKTNIVIQSNPLPKLRLDMDYLVNVYHDLCKDETLIQALLYYPNTSKQLYTVCIQIALATFNSSITCCINS